MATILDKSHKQALLVEITGSSPNAWTLKLCPKGTLISGYYARLMQWGDVVKDDSGLVRTSFTVERRAPITASDNGTNRTYGTLSDLLQVFEPLNAQVTLKIKASNDAAGSETVTVAVGRIVQMSDFGASSGTFHVELRSELIESTVPQRIVKRQAGSPAAWDDDRIPDISIGEVVPLCFGRQLGAVSSLYSTQNAEWKRGLPSFGFAPAAVPAVEVWRSVESGSGSAHFAWCEKVSGGLNVADPTDATNYGARSGYIWEPRANAYARIWNTGSNIVFDTTPYRSAAYTGKTQPTIFAQVPIVPTKVLASSGVQTPEYAIDRKPWTYAGIVNTEELLLEVPQVNLGWRISSNSTLLGTGTYDFEGSDAPPGIGVYVLLVNPSGEPLASSTLRVSVCAPRTTDALFGVTTDVSHGATLNEVAIGRHFLPFTQTGTFGSAADGWGGTKFHNWHFSSAPANSGQDAPLWHTGSDDKDEPFRIRLWHPSGSGTTYVAAVALVVGYQWGVEAYQPQVTKRVVSTRRTMFGQKRTATEKAIVYYGGQRHDTRRAWRRDSTRALEARTKESLSGIYISGAGYIDDGSGTYTGTASKLLDNPAAVCHYLMKQYAGQTSFSTTLGSFGSFANARNNLDSWAAYNGATAWAQNLTIAEEITVDDAVEMIAGETPGLQILKHSNGTWCAHVWIPDSTKFAHELYSATALDAREICLPDPQGPTVHIATGDVAEVTNEIEVNYGWDPARQSFLYVATCDSTTYDDGQGGNWPVAPSTGTDAADIASYSRTRYGRKKRSISAHGIHDAKLAAALGAYHLWRYYRPPIRLRMSCRSTVYAMEVGQIFRLSEASMAALGFEQPWWGASATWDSIYWLCTHIEAQWNNGALTYVVDAEWMPTSIGGEIGGFAAGEEGGAL